MIFRSRWSCSKGNFPCTVVFYQHGGKVIGEVDGPEYYVLPIPNRGLEISINAEFEIASDKLPLME